MFPHLTSRHRFADLSEQEILALAISSEEDDARIYRTYAESLRADYPDTAAIFVAYAAASTSANSGTTAWPRKSSTPTSSSQASIYTHNRIVSVGTGWAWHKH